MRTGKRTKENAEAMRAMRNNGGSLREIRDSFGCSAAYVRQVVGNSKRIRLPFNNDKLMEKWERTFLFWSKCGLTISGIANMFDISRNRVSEVLRSQKPEAIYTSKLSVSRRHRALDALGGECVVCGYTDKRALQIDHIIPNRGEETGSKAVTRILGGDTSNYQCLCANCNWIKRYTNREFGATYANNGLSASIGSVKHGKAHKAKKQKATVR